MLNRRKFLSLSIAATAASSVLANNLIDTPPITGLTGRIQPGAGWSSGAALKELQKQAVDLASGWSSSLDYKVGDITIDADGKRYRSVRAYNSRLKGAENSFQLTID